MLGDVNWGLGNVLPQMVARRGDVRRGVVRRAGARRGNVRPPFRWESSGSPSEFEFDFRRRQVHRNF
jgi:hypothetical protein